MSDQPGPTRRRVVHDPKGNAVWDWAIATGVLNNATLDDLLNTLTGPVFLTVEVERGQPAAGEWAGDPYNRALRNVR